MGRAESSPTKSACSILPIARRLRAGASRGASRPSRFSQKCAIWRMRSAGASGTAGTCGGLRGRGGAHPVRLGAVLLPVRAMPRPITSGAAFARPSLFAMMLGGVVLLRWPLLRSNASGPSWPEGFTFRVISRHGTPPFGVSWAVWAGPVRGFTNFSPTAFREVCIADLPRSPPGTRPYCALCSVPVWCLYAMPTEY